MLTQCIGGHEQRPRALPLQLYGEIAERDKRLLNQGMSLGRDVGVQREILLPGLAGPELDKLPAEAVLEDPLDRLVDAEGRIVLADGAAQRLRGSELALRDQAQLLVARYDSHPRGHEEPGRQAALAIPGWLHEQRGNRPAAADVDHMPSDRVAILRPAPAPPPPGVIDPADRQRVD